MPCHLLPNLALKDFFPVVIFGMLLHFSKWYGGEDGSFLKVEIFEKG